MPKGRGFSGFRLKTPSESENIPGSVDITMQDQTAGIARVNPLRQGLRDLRPTPGAGLRCVPGVHQRHSPPSVLCFGLEDADELAPTRVADALAQMPISHHVGYSEVFGGDEPIGLNQAPSRLVVEVLPGVPHPLVLAGQEGHRPSPAGAAFLPARPSLFSLAEAGFGLAEMPGVSNLFSIAGGQEALQAQVQAHRLVRRGQGAALGFTGKEGIPLAALPFESERLALARHWA